MSLFDDFMQPCEKWAKIPVLDGAGGYTKAWAKTGDFKAAVTRKNTALQSVAQVEGILYIYTVCTPPGVGLERNDYFKTPDGKTYKVTVDAEPTHPAAGFAFESCEAVETELT